MQLTPEQQELVRKARADGQRHATVDFTSEQQAAWRADVEREHIDKDANIAHSGKIKAAAEQPGFFGDIRRAMLVSHKTVDQLAADIGLDPLTLSNFRAAEAELPPVVLDRLIATLGLRLMQEIPH